MKSMRGRSDPDTRSLASTVAIRTWPPGATRPMLDTDDLERMLVEITTGQPPT